MKYLIRLFEIFKKPYPLDFFILKNFFSSITFGVFIFLFLFVFKPFGLNIFHEKELLKITSGYGIVTAVYLIIHLIIIRSFLSEKNWTVGKEILNTLIIISMIGGCNFIYHAVYFSQTIFLNKLITFQLETLAVSIIPIFIATFAKQNRLIKKHLQKAKEINQKKSESTTDCWYDKLITISAQNPKNDFTLNCNDILFFKAQDNYVFIYFVKDSSCSREIIRTTLKKTINDLSDYSNFYHCHKSYIVNLNKVLNITGNAQGLKLQLINTHEIIPVSRQLHEEFTKIYCAN